MKSETKASQQQNIHDSQFMLELKSYGQNYDSSKCIPNQSSFAKDHDDNKLKACIFWTITKSSEIQLALAVNMDLTGVNTISYESCSSRKDKFQMEEISRWIGFGISDMGGMIGSDIFIYVAKSRTILDCHGVIYDKPYLDQCGQDWKYVNSTVILESNGGEHQTPCNGWLVVEVQRSLLAADINEDRPFLDDSSPLVGPTKTILAWGHVTGKSDIYNTSSSELLSRIQPHEPMDRVKVDVKFFDGTTDFTYMTGKLELGSFNANGQEDETELHYIDLIPEQPYKIPSKLTTYKSFCFTILNFPQLLSDDVDDEKEFYIMKFEDILYEGGGQSLVHHMDLHGTTNSILGSDVRLCRVYMDMIHPWEAGAPRVFSMPKEAGIPMGTGMDAYKAFRVEVHYHNPSLYSHRVDQSGVRLYYTQRKPKYNAGLMMLGDPGLKLRGWPTVLNKNRGLPGRGTRHSFYCPPSCFTNDTMTETVGDETHTTRDTKSVTVFKEVFHMHSTGSRMTSLQYNDSGQPIRATEINYFDFRQGAGFSTRYQVPFQIFPGDSFATTCYFEEPDVVFGSGTNQEMCQIFLWYYPKSENLKCNYYDEAMRLENQSFSTEVDLTAHGCEIMYDAISTESHSHLDRVHQMSGTVQNDGNDRCDKSTMVGSRPISEYPYPNASLPSSWPSLFQLVLGSSLNGTANDGIGNVGTNSNQSIVDTSSTSRKPCTLCKGGRKPKYPKKELEGYESDGAGTGWRCEEMDAFIPIMYSNPEILYMDKAMIPPCKDFQNYFGRMCGCRRKKHKRKKDQTESEVVKEGGVKKDEKEIGKSQKSARFIIVLSLAALIIFVKMIRNKVKRSREAVQEEECLEMTPIVSDKMTCTDAEVG